MTLHKDRTRKFLGLTALAAVPAIVCDSPAAVKPGRYQQAQLAEEQRMRGLRSNELPCWKDALGFENPESAFDDWPCVVANDRKTVQPWSDATLSDQTWLERTGSVSIIHGETIQPLANEFDTSASGESWWLVIARLLAAWADAKIVERWSSVFDGELQTGSTRAPAIVQLSQLNGVVRGTVWVGAGLVAEVGGGLFCPGDVQIPATPFPFEATLDARLRKADGVAHSEVDVPLFGARAVRTEYRLELSGAELETLTARIRVEPEDCDPAELSGIFDVRP